MNKIPTSSELAVLGNDLARDGFAAHENRVATVVDLARRGEPHSAAVDALGDLTAPDVVRARAFAAVAARWDSTIEQVANKQAAFDESFARLLSTWVEHEETRSELDVARLWASRRVLDRLRLSTSRRRRRLVGTSC